MASSSIQITADGNSRVIVVNGPQYIKTFGSFGGGTITMNEVVDDQGTLSPTLDGSDAVTIAAAESNPYDFGVGTKLVMVMAGSTTPSVTMTFADINE